MAALNTTEGRPSPAHEANDFEIVDLSPPISDKMAAWRGTNRAEVSMEELPLPDSVVDSKVLGATFLNMATHVGTRVDAALHFFPMGTRSTSSRSSVSSARYGDRRTA